MTNSVLLRANLRKAFRTKRQQLSKHEQKDASRTIVDIVNRHLLANNLIVKGKRVALYLSADGELDTCSLIQYCWKNDAEVYLPVLHPFTKGHLLFLRYAKHTQMKMNKFNIAEPVLSCPAICTPSQLDIIFTPLVAFDALGNRLGMGGGFYDRTLSPLLKEQNRNLVTLIGLAHDCQLTEHLPTEAWDIPLPTIITPTNCYQFNLKGTL